MKNVPGGSTAEQILELIEDQEPITVSELADEMDADREAVWSSVKVLKARNRIASKPRFTSSPGRNESEFFIYDGWKEKI